MRPDPSPAVRALLSRLPVFDAHADTIGRAVDLGEDLGSRTESGHLDLVRGREGGLGAFVVVAWVDPELFAADPRARADAMFDAAHDLACRHPTRFRLVGNAAELDRARADGCISGILGIEGGHPLEGRLDRLHEFFERGLRVLTLVWNNHLPWVRSCRDGAGADIPPGLSEFGREVVSEMNQLGIVVDLSHAAEQSFHDALEQSAHPVIASHSGCRALHDHPRNLTDAQLRALADRGGVVGIVFHPGFLDAGARAEEARVRATPAWRALDALPPAERFLAGQALMRRDASPLPAARLVDHILHAIDVAGIDHVGLGSDFDGIDRGPEWLEDASCYGTLAELLHRRGLSLPDLEKVLGGNMERVFREVTSIGSDAFHLTPRNRPEPVGV